MQPAPPPPAAPSPPDDPLALAQESLGLVTWVWDVGQAPVWHGDLSPLLGLPPGSHRHDMSSWLERLHPDDRDASRERFVACLKGKLPRYRAEERALWPDGSVRWLETQGCASYGPDGRARRLVGVVRDISERKTAEAAALAGQDHLRRLLQEAPVAITISGANEMRFANAAFLTMFGFDNVSQLLGTSVSDRIAPPSRAEFNARTARRAAGEPVDNRYQLQVLRRDGSTFTASISVIDVLFDGANETLVFVEDISERLRAQQALQSLNASLERRVAERTAELQAMNRDLALARDAAEAATRAKGAFLANISHELRTPLNAIVGLSALTLREPDLPPRVQGHLTRTGHAANLLLGLVNDILDFSKIEAGKLRIENRPFQLRQVMDQLDAVIAPGAADKGLEFSLQIDPALQAPLSGDPLRLGQVLLNLCANAVKFTDRGQVGLRLWPQDGELRAEVRDTGIGIAPQDAERLFRPFEQLDGSSRRRAGGTGLGLAICQQLVTLMGGQIELESRLGEGARFTVRLPLRWADATDAADTAAHGNAAGGEGGEQVPDLGGRRLLLVEDNELNRIVATEWLAGIAGAQVDAVSDGLQALQRLQERTYDAVLMDVQMPGMDGIDATLALRRLPGLDSLPVIAMTAHAFDDELTRCMQAGMNDLVRKPVDPAQLFGVLGRWLGRQTTRNIPPAPDGAGRSASAPARAAADDAATAGMDPAQGLQHCLGQPELYRRLLRTYRVEHTQDTVRLRAALDGADNATARRIAHTLVSAAATIGASAVSALAVQLEARLGGPQGQASQGHGPHEPSAAELLDQLERQQARTLAWIARQTAST